MRMPTPPRRADGLALLAGGLLLAGSPVAAQAQAQAQAPGQPTAPAPTPTQSQAPSSYRSDQIDRYEAIRELQAQLKAHPDDEAGWIVLGELAHEVAYELAGEQDTPYYRMSREAYEKALQINPTSPALQAAVQFARDQEQHAGPFDQARRQAVPGYIAARRSELAQAGNGPRVRVYGQPAPAPTQQPAAAPAPGYRYYLPQGGQPYSYQQYSGETMPSVSTNMGGGTPRLGASNPATTGGAVKPAAAAAPP